MGNIDKTVYILGGINSMGFVTSRNAICKERKCMRKFFGILLDVVFFCHKMPDRSFHFKGKQFPVCARCTGLGVGYISSFFVLSLAGLFNIWIAFLLILPMVVDGIGQLLKKWKSNNIRRFITGLIAGIGILYFFFNLANMGYLFGKYLGDKI